MSEQNITPWYKQFWPWFLVAIPLASVIAGINMIILSIDGADSLVKQDYYKEGLSINKQLAKYDKAKSLGVKAKIELSEGLLSLNLTANIAIEESLTLNFSHATIPEKDFVLQLQETSSGNYFAKLDPKTTQAIAGKWYLTLEPYSKQWQLKRSWLLPNSQALLLDN